MNSESLQTWLQRLHDTHAAAPIQLGLARIQRVLRKVDLPLCRPVRDCLVITVAGTNGKGSVCAMLEQILLAAGFRVGCYTSPHLLSYTERFRLNGVAISETPLLQSLAAIEAARGDVPLTEFEHGTLAGLHLFSQHALDVVILEVGLGGRLDATNVVDTDCAIITGIAIDHTDYLGDSRDAIASEKAGIFRPGKPAICGDPQPPETLLAHAAAIGAPLWVSGRDFGFGGDRQQWGYWRHHAPQQNGALIKRAGLAYPALRGANQLLNAATVLTALEVLRERLPVSMQAIREGLMLVDLPGRFQTLPGRPTVVMDVAHNPQAAGVLAENLSNMGFFPETHLVLGMLQGKDVAGVLERLAARVDHWYLCTLPAPRGLAATEILAWLDKNYPDAAVLCFNTPFDAFQAAQQAADEADRIVVSGSFMTVANVMTGMQASKGKADE